MFVVTMLWRNNDYWLLRRDKEPMGNHRSNSIANYIHHLSVLRTVVIWKQIRTVGSRSENDGLDGRIESIDLSKLLQTVCGMVGEWWCHWLVTTSWTGTGIPGGTALHGIYGVRSSHHCGFIVTSLCIYIYNYVYIYMWLYIYDYIYMIIYMYIYDYIEYICI